MEEEYSYDPFQLQNVPTVQKFSLQEKLMAILLVVIFVSIPLYEISSDAFKANYVYKSEPSYICATSYFEENPITPTQYIQGTAKVD
jgi:hypothetical protein